MKIARLVSFVTFGIVLLGCSGSGNNQSDDKTNVRFFNAVPDLRSVDFLVDSDPYFPRTGYLEGSGYFELDTDPHQFDVVATGSFTSLASRSISLADDEDHTLMVLDEANDARLLVLTDDNEPASDDLVKLRIINASNASGTVDVYVVDAIQRAVTGAPVEDNIGFGGVSDYKISNEGRYNILVTDDNSRTIMAQLDNQSFLAEGVYTLIIADSAPGQLPPKLVVLEDAQGSN